MLVLSQPRAHGFCRPASIPPAPLRSSELRASAEDISADRYGSFRSPGLDKEPHNSPRGGGGRAKRTGDEITAVQARARARM